MRIKNLALSLALILAVISAVEARASATQENSFSHPENFYRDEQHASTEKSFVDENRPDVKKFGESKTEDKVTPAEQSRCGMDDPTCNAEVKVAPLNESLNVK